MSLACWGITHCAECGNSLGMNEFFLCKECDKKKKEQEENIKFQKAVAKQVKIELARQNKQIKAIKIGNLDNNKVTTLVGYYEDDIFYPIEKGFE